MSFSFRYKIGGGAPTIRSMMLKDGESVDIGDMVAASTAGTIAVATSAAGTTAMWGVATGTQAESSGSYVYVITDPDAVYGVTDATARYNGDTLTIDSTGGAVVAPAASQDGILQVVANSASYEETLVRIHSELHALTRLKTAGSRIT